MPWIPAATADEIRDHVQQRLRLMAGLIFWVCLVLFGFVYPAERELVPAQVMRSLTERLTDVDTGETDRVCRGTLLSREQFLVDVSEFGYRDARLAPAGTLTPDLLVPWTAEIPLARRATLSPRRRQRRLVSAYNRPPTAR